MASGGGSDDQPSQSSAGDDFVIPEIYLVDSTRDDLTGVGQLRARMANLEIENFNLRCRIHYEDRREGMRNLIGSLDRELVGTVNENEEEMVHEESTFDYSVTPDQSQQPVNKSVTKVATVQELRFKSDSPITHIFTNSATEFLPPSVVIVTGNLLFAVNKWNMPQGYSTDVLTERRSCDLPLTTGQFQSGHLDVGMERRRSCLLPLTTGQLKVLGSCTTCRDPAFDHSPKNRCSVEMTADRQFIMAAGYQDIACSIYRTDTGRTCEIACIFPDRVTCISNAKHGTSEACYLVATGCRDGSVVVWLWFPERVQSRNFRIPVNRVEEIRNLKVGNTEVSSLAVSNDCDLIVTLPLKGPVMLLSKSGILLRSLHTTFELPTMMTLHKDNIVVKFQEGELCVFGSNGTFLRNASHDSLLQSMIVSNDGQHLFVGDDKGIIEIWQTYTLKRLYTFPSCRTGVHSLSLSHDEKFLLAGLGNGRLVVFVVDFNMDPKP